MPSTPAPVAVTVPSSMPNSVPPPTMSPVSAPVPSPVPAPVPAPMAEPPVAPPVPAPTGQGERVTIAIPEYEIRYTLNRVTRAPTNADYDSVTDLTEQHLNTYFSGVLGMSDEIVYIGTETENIDASFRIGAPIRVRYKTTITLSKASVVLPNEAALKELLRSGFMGTFLDVYLDKLEALPSTSLFKGTGAAEFSSVTVKASRHKGGKSSFLSQNASNSEKIGITAAATAGAFFLLLTGVAMYRRRNDGEEVDGKYDDDEAHITVAGDTYTGETYTDSQYTQTIASTRPYEETQWTDTYAESMSLDVGPLAKTQNPDEYNSSASEGSCETDEYCERD